MNELITQLKDLLKDIKTARNQLDLSAARGRMLELEDEMRKPQFWANDSNAAEKSQEHAHIKKRVGEWDELEGQVKEALEMARLEDHSLEQELARQYQALLKAYETKEFELKLGGPYDQKPAVIAVHAGTGGTDAMDFAEMLERMYLRWAEKRGYKSTVLDSSPGEEAGIKSATIKISGEYAYGRLKAEHGVHRLVRQSPFNSANLRQTSFVLVEVLPELPATEEIELEDKDLRIDTFRSGGRGGQSVNTTDSAVRITHLPTSMSVAIQNERSQLQNKETALAILKSKLLQLKQEQNKEKVEELKGPSPTEQWGSQIRNYVLHPYTLVKDTRTGVETADVQSVLNGDIDLFIDAYLRDQIGTG